ncbi:sugar kinase [Ochrobactrum sp. P6BS-III]|uniref:ROK family transcriptional regulator n=1 Tax=unclassified Ochrobactrum TaxID=239106 RepID=UPI0009932DD2|nr:putative NBD/HSP70 family sugar kinase [Ochrobactrum sp. P6BSIII]OOL15744.1 sugar kinase [Ochrobactrum sp. P6BS-III]
MTYDPFDHIADRFLREGRNRCVASRNERDLLRLIWDNPGITRSALTEPFGLTQQSLHRIVEKLHDRGMVVFTEGGIGRSGPRSPGLAPNQDWCLTVGISVNVGSISVALMGFSGLLEICELPEQDVDLDTDITLIEATVDEMLAKRRVSRLDILGIGLAVAGYRMSGSQFNPPQPLYRWALTDLAPLISKRLRHPVWVDNSANMAGLAEAVFGVGRNMKNFAYIAHNYGYGGALIVDGRPFRGGFGNAGELSAMFTLEESNSRPALHLLLQAMRLQGRPELTLGELVRTITPDWTGLSEWIERVTPAHNRAINALCAVFDPEMIVLGGELPHTLARMLIERTLFNNMPRHGVPRSNPRLVVAEVTEAPSALGAALLPLLETVL